MKRTIDKKRHEGIQSTRRSNYYHNIFTVDGDQQFSTSCEYRKIAPWFRNTSTINVEIRKCLFLEERTRTKIGGQWRGCLNAGSCWKPTLIVRHIKFYGHSVEQYWKTYIWGFYLRLGGESGRRCDASFELAHAL